MVLLEELPVLRLPTEEELLRLVDELLRTAEEFVPRFVPEVLRTAEELVLRAALLRAALLVVPTMRPRDAEAVAVEVLAAELVAVVRRPSMRACEEERVEVAAARVLPERRRDDDEVILLSIFLRPALRAMAVA